MFAEHTASDGDRREKRAWSLRPAAERHLAVRSGTARVPWIRRGLRNCGGVKQGARFILDRFDTTFRLEKKKKGAQHSIGELELQTWGHVSVSLCQWEADYTNKEGKHSNNRALLGCSEMTLQNKNGQNNEMEKKNSFITKEKESVCVLAWAPWERGGVIVSEWRKQIGRKEGDKRNTLIFMETHQRGTRLLMNAAKKHQSCQRHPQQWKYSSRVKVWQTGCHREKLSVINLADVCTTVMSLWKPNKQHTSPVDRI